ncbi:MAG: cell wall hydrolase [Ruminococcus sp.]|uniref:cell wall hydrolase n=1 Tax=Ruminococcus sp. TaxID=41978 RepID=UPI0025D608CA|nr:cell wall hydrolase [Ruminococcus sp.]MCR4795375.1 cell wall hydrolase [Ruminococcus sp.]
MGNLKAAALACGVVVSVLGGGVGVAYITSSTVRSADMLKNEDVLLSVKKSELNSTSATIAEDTKATTYNRTTTKKSYTAENTTAASKNYAAAQEGTTSQRATEAATTAAQISRSVPAPAHAPAAITQPVTQAATTAAIVAKTVECAVKSTSLVTRPVTTTTTASTTTTTTTVIEETAAEAEIVETPTEAPEPTTTYVEPETEAVATDVSVEQSGLSVTDEEYILLCNAVAHEAGCNWISVNDKALVVEVIMNRVNSPRFPNTIYDVLTQPYQFSGAYGYVNLGTYSSFVTQSVKDAVSLYLNEPESFTQGYLSFYGDGVRNHFS